MRFVGSVIGGLGNLYFRPNAAHICALRLRSYLGYPPVRDAQPNPTHYALAALQYSSVTPYIITQNVDGLHHKAIRHVWDDVRRNEGIIPELHGTLHVRAFSLHPIEQVTNKHGS